jgi:hypothetical protein
MRQWPVRRQYSAGWGARFAALALETVEFSVRGCVMKLMRFVAALVAITCLLSGCSSTSTFRSPGVDLTNYKRVWVEKNLSDDYRIHEMIAANLKEFGYEVDSGPATMMPRGIELIVTYGDDWNWDFRDYLIDIEITVREVRPSRIIARGRYFRPGITNKAPEVMVREVVKSIFKPGKK